MWRRGPDGEIIRAAPPPPGRKPEGEGGAPAEGAEPRKRARIGIGLRLGLRDTYDYLGSVLVMSFLFAVLASAAMVGGQGLGVTLFRSLPGLLPLVLTLLAAFTGLVLVGGPLAAGLFRFARKTAAREEPDLFDLLWGFRCAPGRSLALAAVQVYGALLLAGNAYFYIAQGTLPLVILGASMGYLVLFWVAMALYQWPLLAEQEISVGRVVKKSALLVLDNLPYTLALLAVVLVLTLVLWISVIGAVLLWSGALAMLTTQATRELLRKYDVLPPDPTLDPISEETLD